MYKTKKYKYASQNVYIFILFSYLPNKNKNC